MTTSGPGIDEARRTPHSAREARHKAHALKHLNVFVSYTREDGNGDLIAVKDLIDVRGTVTTAGSLNRSNQPSEHDALAVALARESGCVVVGKTNLHEWAMGATSENPLYGPVRNPHDPRRIAGGSSGGSAAAVAAELCHWAIGTDTGGSVRIPAALCGVVGFRPTYGMISTEGVQAVCPSLDTVGPIAPDVDTVMRAFGILAGETRTIARSDQSFASLRIGIPQDWIVGLDAPVFEAWNRVSAGATPLRLPERRALTAAQKTIALVEGYTVHRRRLNDRPDQFSEDIIYDLRQGERISRHAYVEALAKQRSLAFDFSAAMSGVDVLLLPTTSCIAPHLHSSNVREKLNRFTRPLSLTGHPVVTIPAPTSTLPVGIQIVGHHGHDWDLLKAAGAVEAHWRSIAGRDGSRST